VAWFSIADVHRLGLYAALATGCASWLPAPAPMRTVASRANPNTQARCLLVLLPGLGDSPEDFAGHGFLDAIRKRELSVDIISANATLGYYARRTLLERVTTDILVPARKAGYQQIWVGGISLGGMGSLLVAQHHGSDLAGIILMAPYLGDEKLITEISNAGGLARWQPPAVLGKDDYQREAWRWLKSATENPGTAPPIYLASGDQDRLTRGHRLLGAALPPERRFRTRGTHEWGPWSVLWADFLDHSDFRAHCAEP
jgi:pimeloyl-ACP methyl ester carboxylesterase